MGRASAFRSLAVTATEFELSLTYGTKIFNTVGKKPLQQFGTNKNNNNKTTTN